MDVRSSTLKESELIILEYHGADILKHLYTRNGAAQLTLQVQGCVEYHV